MRITFYRSSEGECFHVDMDDEEEFSKEGLRYFAERFESMMSHAYAAAHAVLDKFPEFRQVTLDTITDEERDIMRSMKKVGMTN